MEKSGFFNAHIVSGEYDRIYLAEDFADYFSNFIGNGVFGGNAAELQAVANQPADMNIIVKPGRGFINGYWYENTDNLELRIDNADGVLNRIDNIVLRLDVEERLINLVVKKGTPASSAVAPNLIRNNEYYELKLAEVFISAGAISISNSNITDTRLDSAVCGPVVGIVEQIDASQYGSQLNDFINDYINKAEFEYEGAADIIRELVMQLHGLLDDETASHLLAKIINLENTKVPKPISQSLSEGYLYQNKDGSTKLIYGGEVINRFKYTMLIDNGADGTPDAIEYLDDCAGFIPMTKINDVLDEGDWANSPILDCFKPCVIANNSDTPAYFLDKNDLTKKINGAPANLTGADGDVMIQVSKLYGRVTKVGNKAKVSIMNFKESDDCFCFNDIAGVENDYLYRGRYKASEVSGDSSHAMRSISGVMPMVNMTRAVGRTRATMRGTGYHQNNPYLVFLWQFMFMLLFKTRSAHDALGSGIIGDQTGPIECGWSDGENWIFSNKNRLLSSQYGVVFLGVEDFYGNVFEWVDGIVIDRVSSQLAYNLTRDIEKYNDTGIGYEIMSASNLTSENNNKYITQLHFTNNLCCLPADSGTSGSGSNTFFCELVNLSFSYDKCTACHGISYNQGSSSGAFRWDFSYPYNHTSRAIGSRLCRINSIQN